MDGSDTSTWAPQSPDLSSYYLGGDHPPEEPIHPQHQRYRGSISHSLPYSPPTSSPTLQTKPAFFPMPRGVKKEPSRDDGDYLDASETPAIKGKKPKDIVGTEGGNTTLPGTEHIKITSHFPVARIKRIMQADDDVGKVAQVTPVVVSKALELFMISLVTQAATEAKSNGSKRVSTAHLKQAITKNEQFDFLSDIVAKIADAPSADKDNGDAMEVDGKKRKTAGRKKKKADDDDDF